MHPPHPAPTQWPLSNDALYRQFLEAFVDEMYVHDELGLLLDVNQAACDSLGYTRDELIGMYTAEISIKFSATDLLSLWRNHPAGHNVVEANKHRRKDGSSYHVDVHISCQAVDGRKYFLALARNTDEKHRREQDMQAHKLQLEAAIQQRTRQWLESSRLLEAVMQQTPDAVFVKDVEGRYIYGNSALARQLGHPLEKVMGATDWDFYPPADADICVRTDKEALERNEACMFEERLHLNGVRHTVNFVKAPYRDEAGGIVGILGMARNITEMRQAQDLVAHNYEMLRQAERVAKIGSWTLDLTTHNFSSSEMLAEMNGLTPEDPPLTPESLALMLPPQDHAVLSQAIHDCIVNGTPYSVDVQHKRPGGGMFPGRIRGQAYRNAKGEIVMLHGTLQDLTEHVEAEVRLQNLADNLPNGAIFRCETTANADLQLTYVSAGIQGLLGHTASHLMAHPNLFPKAVFAEDVASYWQHVSHSMRTLEPLDVVSRLSHVDGQLRWVRVRAVPRQTHESLMWEGLLLDVTAEHEAQRSLERARDVAEAAEKAKSEFLATMSHEIRTPMNTVIGMTQLLQQTPLSPKQRNYLDKVALSASALLSIINDILDFSKLEADMLNLAQDAFSLDALLDTISAVTSLHAEQKGLEIVYDVHPSVPRQLLGDEQRLGQVLTNLVGNAIKFTERGEVVVTLHATRDPAAPDQHTYLLQVSVRDTGIGMHADLLDQLFTPFTQAEAHISRRYGGTGLGLAISRKLVQKMGGDIQVRSEVGCGSEFSFQVRLRAEKRPHSHKTLNVGECRVLVVDDNPMAREILTSMVSGFGLECATAASGPEALQLLEQASLQARPYRLVLMDWRMPGMDGLEVAERIRKHDQLASTPAMLMVTAYCRDEVLDRVAQLGLQGLLVKPVTESALFNAMHDALHAQSPYGIQLHSDSSQHRLQVPAALRGRRVLVVDDNALNREVAQDFLQLAHMVVTTASSGRDALDQLHRQPFDVVLLDVQMPEMDGLEVARRIRSQPRWHDLPVLALTAQTRVEDRAAILQSGMNGHLTKPMDTQVLYQALCDALGCSTAATAQPASLASQVSQASQTVAALGEDAHGNAHDQITQGANAERRQRLLRAFVRDFDKAPAQLQALQARRAWESLGLLAHTLKSALGYLDQPAATAAMAVLENACRTGAAPDAITSGASARLQDVLNRVKDTLLQAPASTPRERSSGETAQAAPLLLSWVEQALPSIAQGDYAGVRLLEQLESQLRGSTLHGLATRALVLAEDLENAAACEVLAQLQTALHTLQNHE